LTPGAKDPLYSILRSKREVSRLQILVEIAEHQPAVRQQEIAEKLGVTPQAISEYIRELVDEGKVSVIGRGNYEVTKTGIEWVLENAESLESYARHIRRDIIQQVSVWTAIAAEDLQEGDNVGVYMNAGFLYAGKKPLAATGTVMADAKKDEDVGVARLNGIIDHKEGMLHVCKVPDTVWRFEKDTAGQTARRHRPGRNHRCGRTRGVHRAESSGKKTRYVLWCPGGSYRGRIPRDRLCNCNC